MSAIAPSPAPAGTTTPPPSGPRPWRCTREQYAKLGAAGFFQEKQYELIRGEIVDMGKEGPRHYTAFTMAVDALRAAFGPRFYARPAGPLALADSEPQPDVAVVPGSVRDYMTSHPTTALFALEISEMSLDYDLSTKAELYATAGVPEYWVLDLDGRRLHVFRDPAPLPAGLDATAYRTRLTFGPGDRVTPLSAPHPVAVAELLP
jgi:Uma2 family endonuclease